MTAAWRHALRRGSIPLVLGALSALLSRHRRRLVLAGWAIAGTGLTCWRIVRCQPWCRGGHDPVPGRRTRPPGGSLFTSLLSSSDVSSDKKSSS